MCGATVMITVISCSCRDNPMTPPPSCHLVCHLTWQFWHLTIRGSTSGLNPLTRHDSRWHQLSCLSSKYCALIWVTFSKKNILHILSTWQTLIPIWATFGIILNWKLSNNDCLWVSLLGSMWSTLGTGQISWDPVSVTPGHDLSYRHYDTARSLSSTH